MENTEVFKVYFGKQILISTRIFFLGCKVKDHFSPSSQRSQVQPIVRSDFSITGLKAPFWRPNGVQCLTVHGKLT